MPPPDAFFHVRILVGIVTGLSISRLLTGLARPVQYPGVKRLGLIQPAWAIFMLVTIVHFWWFELGLSKIGKWTFGLYLFVIGYAILIFLISTILFPDQMDQFPDPDEYFFSRRRWFYGLLTALFLVDIGDTALKGEAHFRAVGPEYLVLQFTFVALALLAIFLKKRLYDAAFVGVAILLQIAWALRQFDGG
jgi:hypothetical protein